jgi:hypothetical protein
MSELTALGALQHDTIARPLVLPACAVELWRKLRAALIQASNARKLATSPKVIEERVKLLTELPAQVRDSLRERDLHKNAFCIVGGVKNQGRDDSLPHFERCDVAWFDFSITGRERKGSLDLLAYAFEIRLLKGMGSPFLRFDLNLPDLRTEAGELRCHLHPGNDDLRVPAPLMSPGEMLALFLNGVRLPRKPHAPTAFEVSWLRGTLEDVARETSP